MEKKLLSSAEKIQAEIAGCKRSTPHKPPPSPFSSPGRPNSRKKNVPDMPNRKSKMADSTCTPTKKRRKANSESVVASSASAGCWGEREDSITAIINAVAANVSQPKPLPGKRKRKCTQGSSDSEGKSANKLRKKSVGQSKVKIDSDSNSEAKTPPKVSWTRHSSFSENSTTGGQGAENSEGDGDMNKSHEDGAMGGDEGVRKSNRRNRGKRYQELISQGLIQSTRHKQRTESHRFVLYE